MQPSDPNQPDASGASMPNPYAAPNTNLQARDFVPLSLPLQVRMKLISLAPQFFINNAQGQGVAFIQQRLFRFKEAIDIYRDVQKTTLLYQIKADRVIDFSATYHFHSVRDGMIGQTRQNGFKSLWRTEFEVLDKTGTRFFIRLKNPMAQVIEGLLGMIPIVGDILSLLSGYFLNPTYVVTTPAGDEVALMIKQPALWEGKFELKPLIALNERDHELLALSLLTLMLMQRASDG